MVAGALVRTKARRRVGLLGGIAALMIVPVVVLRAIDGYEWDPGDAVFLLILVSGIGLALEVAARVSDRIAYGGPAMPWRLVGGEKLWFVDPEAGRVIACRERNTATVGRRAIDCTERTLEALVR